MMGTIDNNVIIIFLSPYTGYQIIVDFEQGSTYRGFLKIDSHSTVNVLYLPYDFLNIIF